MHLQYSATNANYNIDFQNVNFLHGWKLEFKYVTPIEFTPDLQHIYMDISIRHISDISQLCSAI